MARRKTRATQGTAKAGDDSGAGSAAPSLSELIVQAIQDETPADESRDIRNRLARIEAAVTGESQAPDKVADDGAQKNPGGRPLDVYVGALVDFIAANVAAFGDAVADTLPKIARAADRRVIERYLPVLAEAFDARLIERIRERNRQHFVSERPRLPKDWEHTLADAMRRWIKKKPLGG